MKIDKVDKKLDFKPMDQELKQKWDALYEKFGESKLIKILNVDAKSVRSYSLGKNPTLKVREAISESFYKFIVDNQPYVANERSGNEPDLREWISDLRQQVKDLRAQNDKLNHALEMLNLSVVLKKLEDNQAVLDSLSDLLQAQFAKPKVAYSQKILDQKKGKNAD